MHVGKVTDSECLFKNKFSKFDVVAYRHVIETVICVLYGASGRPVKIRR
jgi:hypothetical protein